MSLGKQMTNAVNFVEAGKHVADRTLEKKNIAFFFANLGDRLDRGATLSDFQRRWEKIGESSFDSRDLSTILAKSSAALLMRYWDMPPKNRAASTEGHCLDYMDAQLERWLGAAIKVLPTFNAMDLSSSMAGLAGLTRLKGGYKSDLQLFLDEWAKEAEAKLPEFNAKDLSQSLLGLGRLSERGYYSISQPLIDACVDELGKPSRVFNDKDLTDSLHGLRRLSQNYVSVNPRVIALLEHVVGDREQAPGAPRFDHA